MITNADSLKIAKDVIRILARKDLKALIREVLAEEEKMDEEPIGIKEASKILGYSVNTIYKIKDRIPHKRVGQRLLFYPSQLKAVVR